MISYADAAEANEQMQEAERLRCDLLKNTKWDKTNLKEAIYLYARLMRQFSEEPETLYATLKEYDQFLHTYRRILREQDPMDLIAPFMNVCARNTSVLAVHKIYREIDILFETVETIRNTHHEKDLLGYRRDLLLVALERDQRLKNTMWAQFAFAALGGYDEDSRLQRFGFLDSLLCLMKEGEKSRQEAAMLRREYPFLEDQMGETLDLFGCEEQEGQFQKLKKEYTRLSEYYEGGVFFGRYPEEKELPRGTLAYVGIHRL